MMFNSWIAMEHYRIHMIEQWPEGAQKEAASPRPGQRLSELEGSAPTEAVPSFCVICAATTSAELPMTA